MTWLFWLYKSDPKSVMICYKKFPDCQLPYKLLSFVVSHSPYSYLQVPPVLQSSVPSANCRYSVIRIFWPWSQHYCSLGLLAIPDRYYYIQKAIYRVLITFLQLVRVNVNVIYFKLINYLTGREHGSTVWVNTKSEWIITPFQLRSKCIHMRRTRRVWCSSLLLRTVRYAN